jgi:hypothetical protein
VQRRLLFEIIALRHQLGLYRRTVGKEKVKPKIRDRDRILWIWLSKLWSGWQECLYFVQPETIIRWERKRFTRFWRQRSETQRRAGRPRISKEHIEIIRRISRENPGWGEDRIADEMELKLGIQHSSSTVRRYMLRGNPRKPTQTWRHFIESHAREIFACDFLTQHTISLHVFYIFVIMELGSRKIVHFNVTDHPTLEWVMQQLREATTSMVPGFLIHDNDGIFGQFAYRNRSWAIDRKTGHRRTFRCRLDQWLCQVMNITGIPTPYGAPNANARLERWHRSLREEALNYFIFLNRSHIYRVVGEHVKFHNGARPSQARHAIPEPCPELMVPPPKGGELIALPVLGGVQHDYRMTA